MFGIVRSSPSPSSPTVEWLDQERPSPKLLKDDSFSIYEATLMKLKQGSRRCTSSELYLSPVSQNSMDFESSVSVTEDLHSNLGVSRDRNVVAAAVCSSDSFCGSVSSSCGQEQKRGKGVSIQLLFSRYTSTHQKQGSGSCSDGSPTSVLGCSSDSESTGCSKVLQ